MSKQIVNVEFQLQTGEFTSSSSPPQSSKCASTSSRSSGDKYILRLIHIAKNPPKFKAAQQEGELRGPTAKVNRGQRVQHLQDPFCHRSLCCVHGVWSLPHVALAQKLGKTIGKAELNRFASWNIFAPCCFLLLRSHAILH